nr:hypothetical protein CFP56_31676 [Quercus suber]
MPSPVRRSTRGALPLTKSAPAGSTTSSSSTSSSKPIRKPVRAQKSSSLYGLSSASPGLGALPRRSQRAQQPGEEEDADETNEEDVTRCVCGLPTYEGPPGSEAFEGVTLEPGQLHEDLGDMFIQCDGCGVWQHDAERSALRTIVRIPTSTTILLLRCTMARYHTTPQRAAADQAEHRRQYSLWVPLHPQLVRKPSTSKSDDRSKRERESTAGRASADPVTGRRRGTMRSKEHDDEEEQLQRALEESKKVNDPLSMKRSGKRSREDSEDARQEHKRPRMVSEAITSSSRTADDDSDDDVPGAPISKSKKAKAEAALSIRQAEQKEKETERERARADAANRRLERAGRRRVDEDPDETPQPTKTSPPPDSSQPPSPQPLNAPSENVSHKKSTGGKKVKKLGNNQYTKNRGGDQVPASSPHGRKRLLHHTLADSGDEQSVANGETSVGGAKDKASPAVGASTESNITNGVGRKVGKGKRTNLNGWHAARQQQQQADEPVELTYTNMKRSLDGMLAFIQRQQFESNIGKLESGSSEDVTSADDTINAEGPSPGSGGLVQSPPSVEGKPFEALTSTEMAEVISRRVEAWTGKYGHLA